MELGHVVGGLTLDECDKLRKVITKRSVSGASKAKEEALKLEKKFIEGAVKNGMEEKVAVDLFEKISFFSGYGFNKTIAHTEHVSRYTSEGNLIEETMIQEIKSGDYLKSRDERTGEDIFVEVIKLHDHGILEIFEFEMDDGSKVRCTMDHKFRTSDGRMLPMKQIIEEGLEIVKDGANIATDRLR
jgi:DNA polymerase-3 subunit alpha